MTVADAPPATAQPVPGNPLFVALTLGLVRLYYPAIATSHLERRPAYGPAIVVANHPNGLLDPLLVRTALGVPTRFLGKSTFWRNPLGRFAMNAFGALPVYRAHEADTTRNEETFTRARALLAGGGWMALFPEGISHDAPSLQPLKTGAARIALTAEAERGFKLGVRIVPVGLLYEDKAIFRSRVGVAVGVPIVVAEYAEAYRSDPRAAADALTRRVAEALGAVVLQADGEALWRGIVAVATWTAPDGGADHAARDRRALALAGVARRLALDDPERLDAAVQATRHHQRLMAALGITDPLTVERPQPVRLLAGLPELLGLAPLALVGALLAWAPYRLVRPLAHHLARGHVDVEGTIKLLLGLLILPTTYLAWTIAAVAGYGAPGLAMLVVGPLTGLAALRFDERLTLRRAALQGWVRASDPRVTEAVAARRRELCRIVEGALGEERASQA